MVQVAVTDAVQVLLTGCRVLQTVTVKCVSALCGGFGFQDSLQEPLEL